MPTILLVDDDSLDRELAMHYLEPFDDAEVVQAANGEEALEKISTAPPDIVLTDLRMPRMDGLELVGKVRVAYPLIPVILMTSRGSEEIALRALKAGAASYVPKRELKTRLAETVRQVLELVEARTSRRQVLKYLGHSETVFELTNDPGLIAALVAFFQENLDRLGFGNDTIRTQVGMAVSEALSNAMIHGNLEVCSSLRDEDSQRYYETIERRREEEPYATRRVRFIGRESTESVEYVVVDEGPGFDPSSLPDPTAPENMVRVRGRGILLIRSFMDEVEFNETGNRITMRKTGGNGIPGGNGTPGAA